MVVSMDQRLKKLQAKLATEQQKSREQREQREQREDRERQKALRGAERAKTKATLAAIHREPGNYKHMTREERLELFWLLQEKD